ncbi:MAG: sulfur relay protein DsrC [Candidatus Thiodiazotropha sp.]
MMRHPEVENFEQLLAVVEEHSKTEIFFRIDVKPPFTDTPENWEDRLEAAFT